MMINDSLEDSSAHSELRVKRSDLPLEFQLSDNYILPGQVHIRSTESATPLAAAPAAGQNCLE